MSQALAGHSFGVEPLAGDPLHDPPSVVPVPLGAISADGPEITVEWSFSQPQGDAQEQFRVELTNDAGDTVYYDSGWLAGTDTSLVIDVDAEGIPHDTSDITAKVQARGPEAIGTGDLARYEISDTDPFSLAWGEPHATIDDPDNGEVWGDLDGVDVVWSFTDDDGANTQGWYRVRLTLPGVGLTLWDTGWVESTDTTYRIPVQLNPGSLYRVFVQLKNNHGIRSD